MKGSEFCLPTSHKIDSYANAPASQEYLVRTAPSGNELQKRDDHLQAGHN
jgi:hypothetical protein